jgi:hypothetical protein
MASKKKYMTSYYVLYACFAIIAIVFAIFFGYGYDNPQGDYNAPLLTDGLLWLMYGLVAVTAALTLWSLIHSVKVAMGTKGENISGVKGGIAASVAWAVLIVSLIVGYVTNLGESEFVASDGTVTTPTMVTVTDMFLFSIYTLLVVTTLAVVVNMTGVMKKKK